MSFHTPWKTLLLILLPCLLIIADDPDSISLLQFQGDQLAGSGIVLSGENDGISLASSWAPDESENLYLADSKAGGEACAGPHSQNQDQQPAKSSKRRKIRRSDHRERDGVDPPDFCRADALGRTRSGEVGQQVDEGQKITPGTKWEVFPLPDSAFFKLKNYNNIFVCHFISFAGSLQASTPVSWLEPCRRCKFTHKRWVSI